MSHLKLKDRNIRYGSVLCLTKCTGLEISGTVANLRSFSIDIRGIAKDVEAGEVSIAFKDQTNPRKIELKASKESPSGSSASPSLSSAQTPADQGRAS